MLDSADTSMRGVPSVVILTRALENSGRVPLGSARTALAPRSAGDSQGV